MKSFLFRVAAYSLLSSSFLAHAAAVHAPIEQVEQAEEAEEEAPKPVYQPNILGVRPAQLDKVYDFIVKGSSATEGHGKAAGFDLANLPSTVADLIVASFVEQYGWFISPKKLITPRSFTARYVFHATFEDDVDESGTVEEALVVEYSPLNAAGDFEEMIVALSPRSLWAPQVVENPTIEMANLLGVGCKCGDDIYSTFKSHFIAVKDKQTGKVSQLIDANKLTGKKITEITLQFSPHKKYVCAAGKEAGEHATRIALIFDYATSTLIKTVALDDEDLFAFSHDEQFIAYGNEEKMLLLNIKKDIIKEMELAQHGGFSCVAFSWDGACVAVGYKDGTVALVDTESGRQVRQLAYEDAQIKSITFSPSNEYMAIVGSEGYGEDEVNEEDYKDSMHIVAKGHYASLQEVLISFALENAKTVEERRGITSTRVFASLRPELQKKYMAVIEHGPEHSITLGAIPIVVLPVVAPAQAVPAPIDADAAAMVQAPAAPAVEPVIFEPEIYD